MSAVPDTSVGRRTIGEILLAHGHVTKEQLDEATAIHVDSGRPLGQILVETSAITRLELASALAEQWSDSGAPIAAPGTSLSGSVSTLDLPGSPAPPAPALDRELLSRVQRVEEALDRLSTSEEDEDSDRSHPALEEITERLALVEPALDELGTRLAALAADDTRDKYLDERLDEQAALVSELKERLAAVGQSAENAARRTDELASTAADALEALQVGLAEISAKLPALAAVQDVEKLRELVDALSQLPIRDEELLEQVAGLQDAVDALGQRPTRDVELITQVDTLATRIVEVGDRVDVLAAAAQTAPGDADALAELQEALAELAGRPQADPQVERRLDDLASALGELGSSVNALASKPAGDPELDQKLWQLASRLEELERADALEDVRTRLTELIERPSVDPALASRLEDLESRVDAAPSADALEDVRTRLTELIERPSVDPALAGRLEDLESRVAAVPGDDVLEELGAGDRSLGFRIDGVVARIDELAVSLEQLGDSGVSREAWDEAVALLNSRLEAEAHLSGQLARIEERLVEVERNGGSAAPSAESSPGLEKHLAALTARMDELTAELASSPRPAEGADGVAGAQPGTASPALERDVEHVLMAIERLSVHLGAHERALTELMGAGGLVTQVRELAARVGDLETYGSASGDGSGVAGGGGDGEMRAELRSLMRRLEEAESAQKNDRERVIDQLEKAAGAIDWRLQRLEAVRSEDPSAT